MERLRQRLAERLSASGKAVPGRVEVRSVQGAEGVPSTRMADPSAASAAPASVARSRPTIAGVADEDAGGKASGAANPQRSARSPGSHTSGPSAGPRGSSAHGAKPGPSHWAYTGPTGPAAWGGLRPEFNLCGKGERQSPIDIRAGFEVELEPVQFNYQPTSFSVLDSGHTVQTNLGAGNSIEVAGQRFELQQFHFHRPSEERIDGRQFAMSLHLVHKDAQGRLAVVALLLDEGPALEAVQQVWNHLPLEKRDEVRARVPMPLAELLPADRRYYTYMGSLTTPPCSEGVRWIVMRQPVTVSAHQIEIFARLYPMNARPLQQALGRRILQSP